MAQHVQVTVSIEGEEIKPFLGITLMQSIHGHHAFEIVLPVSATENTSMSMLQQTQSFVGKAVHIRFGPKEEQFQTSLPDNHFQGLVTQVQMSRSGNGARQVVVRGGSPTLLLDGNVQCRSYTETTLEELAQRVLENLPQGSPDISVNPHFRGTLPYVVQYNESNYAFLQRMAARYGEWCFYDGAKLVFGQLPAAEAIPLPFGYDLFEFDFSLQLQPVRAKAVAHDYLTDTTYRNTASGASVADLDEFGTFALAQSEKTYAQEPLCYPGGPMPHQRDLDAWLQQQKTDAARNLVVANGTTDNPYLNAGSLVEITGEETQGKLREQDYGKFILTSVTHTISGNCSYENTFSAIPAENKTPPPPRLANPSGHIQPGIVKDNADPEGMGRVKVQFYWQDGAETTPWVRVASTLAGKSNGVHGFYFIPEIGDEVLVGFEDNNPESPFVIGSVYHGNAMPDAWYHRDNQTKVIRTRGGNQIHLIDKDGAEEIKIMNTDPGNPTNLISLSMNGQGKITIQTTGDLILDAENIEITARSEIKMTSGKGTHLKAQEITVEADKNIEATAGKTTELKANDLKMTANKAATLKGQQVNVEGTTTKLKGSGQLDVEGGKTALKASVLQIDGGATATVKAGIIQLN